MGAADTVSVCIPTSPPRTSAAALPGFEAAAGEKARQVLLSHPQRIVILKENASRLADRSQVRGPKMLVNQEFGE